MSEFKTRLHSVPSGGFLTDRDKDKKPILDVRELGIDFGGLTAVDNFNLMIGRNEIAGLIGPNGAGKTTSIGKISKYLSQRGKSVLLAAGDTFRAAAREQLAVWGDRNQVEVIAQQGGDPAAVVFDAVSAGKARGTDVVIADTAGL